METDQVQWTLSDGRTSRLAEFNQTFSAGDHSITLEVWGDDEYASARKSFSLEQPPAYRPHVVVGVPDSGFNVYHEMYRRPHLTEHPCTYVRDYPCDVPALNLSLNAATFEQALELDRPIWESIEPGDHYWIPGTNIIGAICHQPYAGSTASQTGTAPEQDYCILDDTSMHGTGVSSSVLSENPEALLVVVEGNSGGADYLTDGNLPIDVVNFSWGAAVPLAGLYITQENFGPFYVAASGNEGAFPVVLDSTKSHPSVITVGGADGRTQTEPGYSSWKTADFVSEYCRWTADTQTKHGIRESYCGTSFAAPTFAGALSKIILELRKASGYDGTIVNGMVDPILGISKWDVRDALNATATYQKTGPFKAGAHLAPLVTSAPVYQYGWGYFASDQVDAALNCIRTEICPEKDAQTRSVMELAWTYREATAWP